MSTIKIEIHVGKNSEEYIEMISKLRIDVFKDYPYLYKGELNYEKKYMAGYTTDERAMIAIAAIKNIKKKEKEIQFTKNIFN